MVPGLNAPILAVPGPSDPLTVVITGVYRVSRSKSWTYRPVVRKSELQQ